VASHWRRSDGPGPVEVSFDPGRASHMLQGMMRPFALFLLAMGAIAFTPTQLVPSRICPKPSSWQPLRIVRETLSPQVFLKMLTAMFSAVTLGCIITQRRKALHSGSAKVAAGPGRCMGATAALVHNSNHTVGAYYSSISTGIGLPPAY
jgi:hypothetical protein